MWPQWTLLFVMVLELGIVVGMNGKPRPNPNYSFLASLISSAIFFTLLYFGGFWKGIF